MSGDKQMHRESTEEFIRGVDERLARQSSWAEDFGLVPFCVSSAIFLALAVAFRYIKAS